MSERTLKRLVGALAVAVALWVIAELVSSGSGSIGASGDIAGFFDDVDAESLEAIRFERADSTVELERAGDRWTVNGFPADSGSVARLLETIPELRIGDLTATNPANHARMGVSEDSASSVDFVVGGETKTLLVGDAGRRFGTSYVRLPGADDVYLLEGDLRSNVRRGLDQWRNRVMVSIDSAAVARIEVEKDGDAYTLVRGDSLWTFESGDSVQGPAVQGILSELAHLVATGFVAEGDSVAALPASSTTRALSGEGELLAEITVGEGTGERWARTASDEYLYRVSTFRADRVAPPLEDVVAGG
jgi:hypothetical protein